MKKLTDINNFWDWFTKNCNKLYSDRYSDKILKELDSRLTNIGLRWEIGPGTNKENSLTISPNGSKEKIEIVKDFINNAPTLDSWEFYNYKQPKRNWNMLEIPEYNIKLSATNWTYTLLKYKDNKKEILIKGDTLADIDPNYRIGIAEIVLINLIGEEKMMNEIDFVGVLELEDNTYEMNKINELNKH
jgi:hypothetical protein